ncbi:MAG: site-specific integrase [Pseudomonadota bacterium]
MHLTRHEKYYVDRWRGKNYHVIWSENGSTRRISLGTSNEQEAARLFEIFLADLNRPQETDIETLWNACREDFGERHTGTWMKHGWKGLQPTFGHLHPGDVTREHCRQHIARRQNDGVSPATIYAELKHLRLALNWAAKHEFIDRVPYIHLPPSPPPRDRFLTRAEAEKLLTGFDAPHAKLFTIVGLQTAARTEAILELTWDRVDFDTGVVNLLVDTGLRRKRRAKPPMTRTLREALVTARSVAETEWVIEFRGKPVKSIRKAFRRATERAGLEDVTPHVLRHTAAVWMANNGVSMEIIGDMLGHSDVRTTRKVYAKFTPEYVSKVLEASAALEL